MTGKALLTTLLASWLLLGSSRGAEPPAQRQIEQQLDELRSQLKVPGAVIGVWSRDRPPLRMALGLADVEHKTPMDTACAFRIASISKVFVGQVVLQLAGEGKLAVDDPISKFVPDVPHGDQITLRHLANHRSGLFNHIESREVKDRFAAEPERIWTEQELLSFSLKAPTYFAPGEQHHYSNANTVLLAQAIEKATGRRWAEEVRDRILKPLELTHTLIPSDNALPDPHAEGYALGTTEGPFFHRGDKLINVTRTSPSWWGPAGSMISTLDDLRRAAPALARGDLLSQPMRAELHRWTEADQSGFEYGFHIERVRGAIGHDGDVPGYQTVMLYFPELDATVVALTNLYGWSVRGMPADRLAWLAAEEHLGVPRKP